MMSGVKCGTGPNCLYDIYWVPRSLVQMSSCLLILQYLSCASITVVRLTSKISFSNCGRECQALRMYFFHEKSKGSSLIINCGSVLQFTIQMVFKRPQKITCCVHQGALLSGFKLQLLHFASLLCIKRSVVVGSNIPFSPR